MKGLLYVSSSIKLYTYSTLFDDIQESVTCRGSTSGPELLRKHQNCS